MGAFTLAALERVDTVERLQVRYQGRDDHTAMLDILVDRNDPEHVIRIGRPGTGYADAQPTAGRAATYVGLEGDVYGAQTLPDNCTLTERVSVESVAQYVMPRIFPFIARIHGAALAES